MQLVAEGDARARNMVAMRLCGRVRRVVRGLVGAGADAEDGAQDALLEILRSAGSYRGDSSLERWADRVCVRTGLRSKRRWLRRATAGAYDPDELAAPGLGGPSDALPRPLQTYLDAIPKRERQVLFLKHALGYTVQEVADMIGAPVSTTKYRLASGLQRVRKQIRRDVAVGTKGGGR